MKAFDNVDTITISIFDILAIESRARPWDIGQGRAVSHADSRAP